MDALRTVVKEYLVGMGVEVGPQEAENIWLFTYETTLVMVSFFSDGDDTYCRVAALLLHEVEPSLELLQRLLRLNTEVLFGAFLLFEDNTLAFSSTLSGNHLDHPEFEKTVRYVAQVAAAHDGELQSLGGGHRSSELLKQSAD